MQKKLSDLFWGLKLAWKIDKKMLLFWGIISVMLAVFPALILYHYRKVLAVLLSFQSGGTESFQSAVGGIVLLGVLIMISGLSARLNHDFLYMTMYDSFYLGLEETMMDAAQRIDLTELVKKEVSDDFFAAISRCGSLTDVTSSGCALLGSIVSSASILVVAASVSPMVCLVALVYVVIVIGINVFMADQVRVVWKELREHLRKADYIKKLVQEGDTAKEVRIFQSIGLLKEVWRDARKQADFMKLRKAKGISVINLVCQLAFYLFLALMLSFGLFRLGQGSMEPEVLLMLFTLGINISEAASKIPDCYQRLDYGIYGLGIQREFFEKTPSTTAEEEAKKKDVPADETTCFLAEHLNFAYSGGNMVLKDLSFSIKRGETIALVGANGSGKTTLLKVMMGLYRPLSGKLLFQGREYSEYKQGYLSRKIGAFFQDFILFHLTVQENVGLGNTECMEDEKQIWDALEKGGMAKLVATWKNGIHQRLLKNVYSDGIMLSGGESQRMAVARTHMSDKEILIFDEPASMLDPVAEMEQFQYIKQKLKDHTAILVSHRVGFARLADRIFVLDQGRLAECGTHEELLAEKGIYAEMFYQQAKWYDLAGVKRGNAYDNS